METNMKSEFKDSQMNRRDSCIVPKNSKWLAENIEATDHSVKQMRKLIEDGESLSNMHRPELVAHIEDFYHLYRSLAERYDHLTGELQKNMPLDFQLQGFGNSKSGSPLLTPDHKLSVHKSGGQAASSTSGGSSDFSLKEGTELSSLSSSDSESESFNSVNIHLDAPINIDGKGLHEKIEENADSLLEVRENGSYEELLERVMNYEEQLRVSNLRLQLSEEEVTRLKGELNSQIESVQSDIKMRETDLEMERRQVFELQNYISELETHASESNFEFERLVKELEVSRERLKGSDEEIERLNNELANEISEDTYQLQGQLKLAQEEVAMLNAKLDSEGRQILKLQERIARYESQLSERDDEIRELKFALSGAQEKFSLEKACLQSDLSSLLEKQTLSDARIKEWELQSKVLEDKIVQCETEKMEMKDLHEAQESGMRTEINGLKVEVAERGKHIEALNKNLDGLKFKYDMLMVEKDEVNAKVNTLMAEASSREIHIGQAEEHLQRLHIEHGKLVAESETARKQVDDLRQGVKELEKEVEWQRMVIMDGAEKKREAIRQLCFSLEHYRSGYKELRQTLLGFKRPAVMAA